MLPEAPARLSTTTGWPQRSPSFCATRRAMMSVPPPGAKPTTRRTGLAGYAWAPAAADHAQTATRKSPRSCSVHMRARRLDDRRPLGELRPDEGAELLGRGAGRGVDADVLQVLEHHRIRQRSVDGAVQLPDDRRRRARR